MKRILFVDDEPNVLQGLQRMLRPMRHEWEVSFATGGQEALEILDRERFDVVVSDMRMPGMNGAQLLWEVMRLHPEVVRIVLSGQSDREHILQSVGPAHQYLSKPCDTETLKCLVARACRLRDLLADESLQRLMSRMKSLPSVPALYTAIMERSQDPNVSIKEIGGIISRDMGMTAKILQLVNSAFFGLPRQITDPAQAVSLLGLDTVRSLVLSCQVFSQFDVARTSRFSLQALWNHSLRVAAYARRIARLQEQDQKTVDAAFTAGLLHDAGKLALAANLPEQYDVVLSRAQEERMPVEDAEREILGATHADVGAFLMGLWGLPDPIVEAIAFHHVPATGPELAFSPLTAVHAANVLDYTLHEADPTAAPAWDFDYLTALGLADCEAVWEHACRTESLEKIDVGGNAP